MYKNCRCLCRPSSCRDNKNSHNTENSFPRRWEHLEPQPPPDMDKEYVAIWINWTYKSDRELIREAATKGFIPLAEKFLVKRNLFLKNVKDYVRHEVLQWVNELLSRKLIFSVSSILENTSLNPAQELQNIFRKTEDRELRDYIGDHLKRNNCLPNDLEQLWIFLKVMVEQKPSMNSENLFVENIESLCLTSELWKQEVAAKLFLQNSDNRLVPFIRSEILWNQLLIHNRIDLILLWIETFYTSRPFKYQVSSEIIMSLLQSLSINDEMLNSVTNLGIASKNVEKILNRLAIFGVFVKSEKPNILSVLSRVNSADCIVNIYTILQQESSNLPLPKYAVLLVNFCLANDLLIVLNSCVKSCNLLTILETSMFASYLNLIKQFERPIPQLEEHEFYENILNVSKYLSSDSDFRNYLSKNPLVFLSLLLFNNNISIETAIDEESLILDSQETHSALSTLFTQLPILSKMYIKQSKGVDNQLTYLDLLSKHHKIDVNKLYSFHFQKKSLPNFTLFTSDNDSIYTRHINYTIYLKYYRPCIASRVFYIDLLTKNIEFDDEYKNSVKNKVYKLAIKNLLDSALAASCTSFLEIIGIDSEFLQIDLKAANILRTSSVSEAEHQFLNIETSASTIQTNLENIIMKMIDLTDISWSGDSFSKAIAAYDIVIKFSVSHQLSLPEQFLTYLSQNNLWFPFLLYSQMKQYPAEQVKALCTNFKNPSLLEHVTHSLQHDIQINERTNGSISERDSRKYLLSKRGVRKFIEKVSPKVCEIDSLNQTPSGIFRSSLSSHWSNSESLEIDLSNTKATLLQTIIRCCNSADPPNALLQACCYYKNPLLAIFATGFEPGCVIKTWLLWLVLSTDSDIDFISIDAIATSGRTVSNLLNDCVKNNYLKTVAESFLIFIPDNPLSQFVSFILKIIQTNYETPTDLSLNLKKFLKGNTNRLSGAVASIDFEMNYLKNRVWIQSTALQLLASAIVYNTDSHFKQLEIIRLLNDLEIANYFSCKVSSLGVLSNILNTILETGVSINICDYFNNDKMKGTIEMCINELVDQNLFNKALEVATYASIGRIDIVLRKWEYVINEAVSPLQEILVQCDEDFIKEHVPSDKAISFFQTNIKWNLLDKYYLKKMSYNWATRNNIETENDLERDTILTFIGLNKELLPAEDLIENNGTNCHTTYKEMLERLSRITLIKKLEIDEHNMERLNALLNKFLDTNHFWMALKLEKLFNCKSIDLEILKLCHALAEGLISPKQMNDEQQKLISDTIQQPKCSCDKNLYHRKLHLSENTVYESNRSKVSDPFYQDTLTLIHNLLLKINHGSYLAYSIFIKYRISYNIDIPYSVVVSTTDYSKMLKTALDDNCSNKIDVIHDFFEIFSWTQEQITDFICSEFVIAVSNYTRFRSENFILWDLNMDSQFDVVLRLFKVGCSTMGYKLYNYANAVHHHQILNDENFKISEMSLIVELLIAAHTCFTNDCNMEGISLVLRKCHLVITHLVSVRSWKLIVRLFTAIGRYSELNCVFRILKENQQFEFLLSKGSKRDVHLKQSCIEYLKKHYHQERELYRLVAIHFNMYSDIALVYETDARKCIEHLLNRIKIDMVNIGLVPFNEPFYTVKKSDIITSMLDKAMENYVLSTEFYIEGQKLTESMQVATQAELIALQKSMLYSLSSNESSLCILDLNDLQIGILITEYLDFHQSKILVEAYNYTPDWSNVLFEQAIKRDNLDYYHLFNLYIGSSEKLVQDIAKKFISSNNIRTEYGQNNMIFMVSSLPSIYTKYRLASELGFTKLAEKIISDGQISYLKDTVWKVGYKA